MYVEVSNLWLVSLVGMIALTAFFAGAWVFYRGKNQQSPAPKLPQFTIREPVAPEPPAPPRPHIHRP